MGSLTPPPKRRNTCGGISVGGDNYVICRHQIAATRLGANSNWPLIVFRRFRLNNAAFRAALYGGGGNNAAAALD